MPLDRINERPDRILTIAVPDRAVGMAGQHIMDFFLDLRFMAHGLEAVPPAIEDLARVVPTTRNPIRESLSAIITAPFA
jgi:hypothetical protein